MKLQPSSGKQRYTNGDVAVPGRDSITFSKEILPLILSLKDNPHSFVLDVGCGNGRMLKLLLPYYPNIVGIEPLKRDYHIEPYIEKYIEEMNLHEYQKSANHYILHQGRPKHDIVLMNAFVCIFDGVDGNASELIEILDQITNENALYIISGDPINAINVHKYFEEHLKLERYIEINSEYFYGLYTK
jgi:SAM-dependent methyltransferase